MCFYLISVPQHSSAFLNDNNTNFANNATWNYSTFWLVILTERIWFLPSFSVVNLASTVIDRLVCAEIVRWVNLQQEMLEWTWYGRRSFSNHSKAAEHEISWQFRPGSIWNNCCRLAWTSDTVNTKATTTTDYHDVFIHWRKLFMNVIRRQLRLVLIMIIQTKMHA